MFGNGICKKCCCQLPTDNRGMLCEECSGEMTGAEFDRWKFGVPDEYRVCIEADGSNSQE